MQTPDYSQSRPVRAAVLLRHIREDGSFHYDWLWQACDQPGQGLVSFRLAQPPSESFDGERLPDHRPVYLTYEGDIGGGRGVITRVRHWEVVRFEESPDALLLTLRADGQADTWRAAPLGAGVWSFLRVASPNSAP